MLSQFEKECLWRATNAPLRVSSAPSTQGIIANIALKPASAVSKLAPAWLINPHSLLKDKSMTYQMIKSARALSLVPLTALCLVSAVAQAQTAPSPGAASNMPHGTMQQGTNGSEDMKHAMMMGMDSMQKMPISGNIDKDFAMMMKMHHQQGVDMAKIELAQGKSPVMKAMAKQIIAAQNKEISRFDQWLAKQK